VRLPIASLSPNCGGTGRSARKASRDALGRLSFDGSSRSAPGVLLTLSAANPDPRDVVAVPLNPLPVPDLLPHPSRGSGNYGVLPFQGEVLSPHREVTWSETFWMNGGNGQHPLTGSWSPDGGNRYYWVSGAEITSGRLELDVVLG
jgi:hypothetical protein